MTTILAIDPGTHCGWAVTMRTGVISSGTWDLRPNRYEGAGMRWLRLRSFLDQTAPLSLDLVAYEEVRHHAGVDAAHIYGGIVSVLQSWCETLKIPYTALPVGTIKKHATGKGNAKKDAMLAAARERWPGQMVADDNQADALWIMDLAVKQYGKAVAS
jgi:Holliday junction resolvasome RuvABC endonuclease subunit